jgi:hypothetical protein
MGTAARRLGLVCIGAAIAGLAACAPVPPTVYPPPTSGGAVPWGSFCYAGAYTCPASGPVGAQCACPGLGAPSYGAIR